MFWSEQKGATPPFETPVKFQKCENLFSHFWNFLMINHTNQKGCKYPPLLLLRRIGGCGGIPLTIDKNEF